MLGALAAALAGCPGGEVPQGDAAVPDVVMVSIDTLRADHLGSYGYHRPTSPFIDSLAADGLRWEHARSPSPWTLPSHVTMLSGWLPHRHMAVEDDIGVATAVPWLAESMKAAGFTTGGFTSTLYVSRTYGFERGFDEFDDFGIETSKQNLKGEVTATDVVDRALRWVKRRDPGEPVFLFLHFYDAHYAYDPPPPYDSLFDRPPSDDDTRYRKYHHYLSHPLDQARLDHQIAQYDEAIRYVDSELERLHGALDAAGRQATWLVTADHGEEFGERGSWGHAHTLYPEQLHVPLVISGARIGTAAVMKQVVGLEDLAPGLASLVGVEMPAGDGHALDLDPLAPPVTDRAYVSDTSRFSTNRLGLWLDGWRFDLDLASGTRALYRTREDPQEQRDLAAEEGEKATSLEQRLWRELGSPWEAREATTVTTRRGRLVLDGKPLQRKADLPAGARFQLAPVDTQLRLEDRADWYRAPATLPPADAALVWHGDQGRNVDLTPRERSQLEALGYLQGDDDAE